MLISLYYPALEARGSIIVFIYLFVSALVFGLLNFAFQKSSIKNLLHLLFKTPLSLSAVLYNMLSAFV
jgi:hypothetical protein